MHIGQTKIHGQSSQWQSETKTLQMYRESERMAYFNYIIIFYKSKADYLDHIQAVFEMMRKLKLKLKLKKYHLFEKKT